MPCNAEKAVATADITESVTAKAGDGSDATCGSGEVWYEKGTFAVPVPDLDAATWEPAGGGHDIITSAVMDGTCDGAAYVMTTSRDAVKFRFAPMDDDLVNAIPEAWRDQFESDPRVLVSIIKTHKILSRAPTDDFGLAEDCAGQKWTVDASHWLTFPQVDLVSETVCDVTGNEFTAPPIDSYSNLFYSSNGCVGGPEYRWAISLLASATSSIKIELV